MRVKTIFRRPLALALSLLLCAVCLTPGVGALRVPSAIDNFDPNHPCSLTITYPHAEIADTRPYVRLYQVASVDADLNFVPVGGFAGIAGLAGDLAAARRTGGWSKLVLGLQTAAEMGSFAKAGGGPKQVSADGKAYFTGLRPGLYLVTADNYQHTETVDGETKTVFYTPSSYLICLPNYVEDAEGNYVWSYDVESISKFEENTREELEIHVFKVWDDQDDRQGIRPESVTVALLQGGVKVDEAVLHAGNNWRHTWTVKNGGAGQWMVTELNAPSGYRFTVTKTGTNTGWTFSVENSIPGSVSPPSDHPDRPPVRPGDPGDPGEPQEPDIPLEDPEVPKSDPPEEPPSPDDELEIPDDDVPLADLPQTGQLWWPVPFLAAGGMFFLLVGAVRRRRDEYEEE